jgi:hypothetical protein
MLLAGAKHENVGLGRGVLHPGNKKWAARVRDSRSGKRFEFFFETYHFSKNLPTFLNIKKQLKIKQRNETISYHL